MIEVTWSDTQDNVVLWKFPLIWTWQEFFAAKAEVDAMIDGVEGIADSIFLIHTERRLPEGGIRNLKRIVAERHARHDVIVIVGPTMFLTSLLSVILKIVPGAQDQLHYAQSIDEAYAIIENRRQKRRQRQASQVAEELT